MEMIQSASENNRKEKLRSTESFFCHSWRYVRKPYHYHPHWHDFLELVFVRKGYLKTTLRNTSQIINEGELLVVMPGEIHSFSNEGEGILEFFVIQIDACFLEKAIFDSREFSVIYPHLFGCWTPDFFFCGLEEIRNNRVLQVINNLYTEIQKKELGYSLSVEANLIEIFVWLLRRWNKETKPVTDGSNFIIGKRMQPVLDFVRGHYREDISTRDAAEKMAMSVPHFCRLFKKLTGCSFHNYLRSLRIVEAVKLLLSTEDSVGQIAAHVGYNDVNFFCRVFRKQTGVPPYQYRKKYAFSLPVPLDGGQ